MQKKLQLFSFIWHTKMMKKLTLLFLIFFITLNNSSYSENPRVKIYSDEVGAEYIDIQNIRKNNEYIFFLEFK